jgi:hypothetical protein
MSDINTWGGYFFISLIVLPILISVMTGIPYKVLSTPVIVAMIISFVLGVKCENTWG